MKARRKGTNGEWQEVQSVILADNEWTIIKAEDIEFQHDNLSTEIKNCDQVDEEKHWKDVRERAAIAAMHGIILRFETKGYAFSSKYELYDGIANDAVEYADALVKLLKNGKTEISK